MQENSKEKVTLYRKRLMLASPRAGETGVDGNILCIFLKMRHPFCSLCVGRSSGLLAPVLSATAIGRIFHESLAATTDLVVLLSEL
jgi:hypothetical protein